MSEMSEHSGIAIGEETAPMPEATSSGRHAMIRMTVEQVIISAQSEEDKQ